MEGVVVGCSITFYRYNFNEQITHFGKSLKVID